MQEMQVQSLGWGDPPEKKKDKTRRRENAG